MKKGTFSGILILLLLAVASAAVVFALFPFSVPLMPIPFVLFSVKIKDNAFRTFILLMQSALFFVAVDLIAEELIPAGAGAVSYYALAISALIVLLSVLTGIVCSRYILLGKAFRQNVGYTTVTYLIGLILIGAYIHFAHGQDIVASLVNFFTQDVSQSLSVPIAKSTIALSVLWHGLLAGSTPQLPDITDAQALLQFKELVLPVLRTQLAGYMICMSLLVGLLTCWIAGGLCNSKKLDFLFRYPIGWDIQRVQVVPPFALVLPRKAGFGILLLIAFAFLAQASMAPLGDVYWQTAIMVFLFVFTVDGVCAAEFLLKRTGLPGIVRTILLAILSVILGQLLLWAGILDWLLGFRERIYYSTRSTPDKQ